MSDVSDRLDPENQPAMVRVDRYQEWRKREGAPLVGGVYIRDMKAVDVGPWPRKGDGVKGALCYLDGDDEGRRAYCRTAARRLHRAAPPSVYRSDLRRIRSWLDFGLARPGSEANF